MHSNPELELFVRHVRDAEGGNSTHEMQGHGGNLCCMLVAIQDGKAADHHIGIPNGLYLKAEVMRR